MINTVQNIDCLVGMQQIPDKSIDMILCDLPYGTTACKWDVIIPFEPLWKQYERVIKDNGAIVLTASQPFTTVLINSNLKRFKYNWTWDKVKPGAIGIAKYQPLRVTEDVCVFSIGTHTYIPQLVKRDKPVKYKNYSHSEMNHKSLAAMDEFKTTDFLYPKNLIQFSNADQTGKVHPTQKPVALFEYLIKTYTNEGETVLDNCMGSGTTAIACINTNRNYIGFEKEEKYYNIIQERIKKHKPQLSLAV
jgi:site-specific DNA-methyltransferase (adenine-specific)